MLYEGKAILNYIEASKAIRLTKIDNDTISKAKQILQNKFIIFDNLDIIDFKEKIDWNYKHSKSNNTYQLYLHSLTVLSYLCNAYEVTKDVIYLRKAYDIILDWAKFDNTSKNKPQLVWCDHSVSDRTINIIYFVSIAEKVLDFNEEKIYDILLSHAEYLYNDKKYKKDNHGLMMDRALICNAIVLKDNPCSKFWLEKAIFRVREAFLRDFSYKAVHLENSPEYHSFVKRMFLNIQAFLENQNLTLGKDIKDGLDMTEEYFKFVLMPNNKLPMIGDTGTHTLPSIKKAYEAFIDTQAGICILQSKDEENNENSTWISFICGYGSKVHKHNDDLSFNLCYKGKEIFIDSGKYNYDSNDKIRKYIVSPLAHSTITVEGEGYQLEEESSRHTARVKIVGFINNDVYDYVKGINYMYNDIKFERTLLFLKPNIIIIVDSAKSSKFYEYKQIFNLNTHIEVKHSNKNKVILQSENSLIEIEQFLCSDKLNIHKGDLDTPRAVISNKFGKLDSNTQLEFIKQGENIKFCTLIKMDEGRTRLKNVSLDDETEILKVEVDDKEFNFVI